MLEGWKKTKRVTYNAYACVIKKKETGRERDGMKERERQTDRE
jgi:hypothetical protein